MGNIAWRKHTPDDATIREWVQALVLLEAEVSAAIEYAQDTTFCSDCPNRFDADDLPYVQYECCKETGEFDEQFTEDYKYINKIQAARVALRALIADDSAGGDDA